MIVEPSKMPMRILFFILFTCLVGNALSQDVTRTFSINGVVIDSLTGETIPFVSIAKKRDRKGTLSDFDGVYLLDDVLFGDTVTFSLIDYEKRVFVFLKNQQFDTIYLNKEFQQLDEVIVLADKSILYELIDRSQGSVSKKKHVAKTYFELETYSGKTQLELFQGYYNGTFQGYDAKELKMKQGRFALAPISNRVFASTESSKAMSMHQLVMENSYFPTSPFELKKKQLRQTYDLALNSKYHDDNGNLMYVIKFDPKVNDKKHFSGNVWIDSASAKIHKVILRISDAQVHPFASIWSIHSLDRVSMEITKSYEEHNNEMRNASIDFLYNLTYLSKEDSALNVSTRAILHAFNYDETFKLPYFQFSETSSSDYRTIQMLPYNRAFWKCENDFKIESSSEKRSDFIQNQATIQAYDLFSTDSLFENNFFENPYVAWTGNRIIIKGLSADSSNYYDERRALYANRYQLKVQLFVDVNTACDSIEVITKTIFDPYESYFHFETTKENQAFLNIYFDLMELERRELARKLESCKHDDEGIEREYAEALERAKRMSALYFKEVQRGTHKEALVKWNKVVREELNIDNLVLFGIDE